MSRVNEVVFELAQPRSSSNIDIIKLSAPSPVFFTSIVNVAVVPGNFSISVTSVLISTPLLKSTLTVRVIESVDFVPFSHPSQSDTPLTTRV